MLIELIILGDYFLVYGLVDAARNHILEVCSDFTVKFWSRHPGEQTKKHGTGPSFNRITNEVMKAITLTSAASGPTQPFRKFLVKFIIDVLGCAPGVSAWSHTETFVFTKQLRFAPKLRDLATSMPGLENELKAALFDSAFPNLSGKCLHPRQLEGVDYCTPDDRCSTCKRHLDGDEGDEGLIFGPSYGNGKESCCLHCAKDELKIVWRGFMLHDSRQEELLTETDQDSPDQPDVTASM